VRRFTNIKEKKRGRYKDIKLKKKAFIQDFSNKSRRIHTLTQLLKAYSLKKRCEYDHGQ
jgi:hypothetical protein